MSCSSFCSRPSETHVFTYGSPPHSLPRLTLWVLTIRVGLLITINRTRSAVHHGSRRFHTTTAKKSVLNLVLPAANWCPIVTTNYFNVYFNPAWITRGLLFIRGKQLIPTGFLAARLRYNRSRQQTYVNTLIYNKQRRISKITKTRS